MQIQNLCSFSDFLISALKVSWVLPPLYGQIKNFLSDGSAASVICPSAILREGCQNTACVKSHTWGIISKLKQVMNAVSLILWGKSHCEYTDTTVQKLQWMLI